MRMLLRPGVIALAALVAACGSVPFVGGGGEREYRRTVELDDASYDEAWTAIIETFGDLELPIATLEKDSGLVATDWILLRDPARFMDCDGAVRNQEGRYNVFLKQTTADPEMTITSSYRAEIRSGDDPGASVRCETTERMESDIQRRVEEKVD